MYRFAGAAVITALIAASGHVAPAAARAETGVSVSFSYFRSNLSPHGRWFNHPRYGQSWRPQGVAAGWRPYTNGRWEWTEEYGWTWASYYNWGWAPFHYGRWVYDRENSWYWVPGYEWGPAWVSWRHGDGFIGWYPLPPEAVWRPGVGIVYSGTGIYGTYYTPYWVFVPERQFLSTRISNVLVRPHDNARFIRNTRHTTNYGWVNNRVVNRGLDRSYIGRVTGKRVVATKPRVVTGRGDWRAPTPGSREVRIFRPPAVERRGGGAHGPKGGTASVPKGGNAPGSNGRAAPGPDRKAAPVPRGGTASVPKGRDAPRSNGKVAPRPEGRAAPVRKGGAAPAQKGRDAPVQKGGAAAGRKGGADPRSRGDTEGRGGPNDGGATMQRGGGGGRRGER